MKNKEKELDNLVNSFNLEELEERIELGCFPGATSSGSLALWTF